MIYRKEKLRSHSFLLLIIIVSVFLTACEHEKADTVESDHIAEIPDQQTESADGFDYFGDGLWKVRGVYIENQYIDIREYDALADLYDSTFLSFNSDGTFSYMNLFIDEGKYVPYSGDGNYRYFLLKTEHTLKFDSSKGDFVENENGSRKTFIVAILDENLIEFCEFDSLTGNAKVNSDPLFFERDEETW